MFQCEQQNVLNNTKIIESKTILITGNSVTGLSEQLSNFRPFRIKLGKQIKVSGAAITRQKVKSGDAT